MAHVIDKTFKLFHIEDLILFYKKINYNFLTSILNKIERRETIHRTEKELHSLTDRELNDIGISRHDIYRIAREL